MKPRKIDYCRIIFQRFFSTDEFIDKIFIHSHKNSRMTDHNGRPLHFL